MPRVLIVAAVMLGLLGGVAAPAFAQTPALGLASPASVDRAPGFLSGEPISGEPVATDLAAPADYYWVTPPVPQAVTQGTVVRAAEAGPSGGRQWFALWNLFHATTYADSGGATGLIGGGFDIGIETGFSPFVGPYGGVFGSVVVGLTFQTITATLGPDTINPSAMGVTGALLAGFTWDKFELFAIFRTDMLFDDLSVPGTGASLMGNEGRFGQSVGVGFRFLGDDPLGMQHRSPWLSATLIILVDLTSASARNVTIGVDLIMLIILLASASH